ncbi:MAG: galactokinase family protein, partial [Vicinamibacterales bacterium]
MSSDDAASRAALIELADHGFRRDVGSAPDWLWFVPGRIEIFGKHTDYAGGRSLLCTVPRGIAVAACPRPDRIVRVIDLSDNEVATIDLASNRPPRPGLDHYASVVARRLGLNFPEAQLGAEIAILSDLPRAAGVSSSSALVVGIASALIRRASLDRRPEWRANINSTQDRAWYLGCVENGLSYRALPSSSGVGTLGGSEDHAAILACRAGHVSQYRFVPVHHINDVVMPPEWAFLVVSSGVHADKAGGVRELYNRASRATQVLLDIWNSQTGTPARSLGEALDSNPEAADKLRELVNHAPGGGFTSGALQSRLDHFVREDRRVPAAAQAFATADAEALRRLAADSQSDADRLLGNQVPQTRTLVELALDSGAFAASSFGAGFGGSVWA